MHKKKLYNFILIETLSKELDKNWRSSDKRDSRKS